MRSVPYKMPIQDKIYEARIVRVRNLYPYQYPGILCRFINGHLYQGSKSSHRTDAGRKYRTVIRLKNAFHD